MQNGWLRAPLRLVAPAKPASVQFKPDEPVWQLTLDQIEADTGSIVNKKIAPAKEAGSSTHGFDTGNVLYSKLRPYLNKVIRPHEKGLATTELVPMRPKSGVLEAEFLTYYLRSAPFVQFASQFVAGAKMPRVMMNKFWAHEIPLPPPSEQGRIVEILDQVDALRKKRAEADKIAERILPALFYKMFGDPISNSHALPVDYVKNIIEEPTFGLSAALSMNTQQVDDWPPVLRIPNITTDGYLDVSDLRYHKVSPRKREDLALRQGDLLFNWRNSPNWIGRTAIFDAEGEFIFASFLYRIRVLEDRATSEYLWFFFNELRRKGWFEAKSRRAVSQANFGRDELCDMRIPLPSLTEQRCFSDHVAKEKERRAQRRDATCRIESIYQVLLHRAFSGALTAKWREAHIKELLQEMELQAKELKLQSD